MSLSNSHITTSSNSIAEKSKQVQLIFSSSSGSGSGSGSSNSNNTTTNVNAIKRTAATDYGDDVNNKRLKSDININIKSNKSANIDLINCNSSSSSSNAAVKEEQQQQLNENSSSYTLETLNNSNSNNDDLLSLPSSDITEEYVLFTTDVMDYMDVMTSKSSNTPTVPLNAHSEQSRVYKDASITTLTVPKETDNNKLANSASAVSEIELVVLPSLSEQTKTNAVLLSNNKNTEQSNNGNNTTQIIRRHTTSSGYNCSIESATAAQTTPTNATLFNRSNLQTTIKNRPLIVSAKNRIAEVTQTTAKVSIGNTTISVPLLKPLNASHIVHNETAKTSTSTATAAVSSNATTTTATATTHTQLNLSKILNVKRSQKGLNQPTIVSLSQLQIKPVSTAKIVQAKVLNKKMPLQLKHFTTTAVTPAAATTTATATTLQAGIVNISNSGSTKLPATITTTTTTKLPQLISMQEIGDDDNFIELTNSDATTATTDNIISNDATAATTIATSAVAATTSTTTATATTNIMKNLNLLSTLGSNGSTVLTKVSDVNQLNKSQVRSTVSIIKQQANNEHDATATTSNIKKLQQLSGSNNNNKPTLCLNTNATSLIAIPRNISLMLAKSGANMVSSQAKTSNTSSSSSGVTAHILNSAAASAKKLTTTSGFNITGVTTQRRMSQMCNESPYKQAAVISCVTMMKPLEVGNISAVSTTTTTTTTSAAVGTSNKNNNSSNQNQSAQAVKRAKSADDKDDGSPLKDNKRSSGGEATQAKRICLSDEQHHNQQQQQQQQQQQHSAVTNSNNKLATIITTTTTTSLTTLSSSSATTTTSNTTCQNKPEEAHNALLKQLLQNTTTTTIVSVAASSVTGQQTTTNTATLAAAAASSAVSNATNNSNNNNSQATTTTTAATTKGGFTPARKVINVRAPSLGLVSSLEAQLARPALPPVPAAAGSSLHANNNNNNNGGSKTIKTSQRVNTNTGSIDNQQQQQQQKQQIYTSTSTTAANLAATTATPSTNILNNSDASDNKPTQQQQQQQQQQHLLQHMPSEQISTITKNKSNVQIILKETSFVSNPNMTQHTTITPNNNNNNNNNNINNNNNQMTTAILSASPATTTTAAASTDVSRRPYNITLFNNNNNSRSDRTTTTATITPEIHTSKQTLLDALLNNNRNKNVSVTTTANQQHQQQEKLTQVDNNYEKQQQQQQSSISNTENNNNKNTHNLTLNITGISTLENNSSNNEQRSATSTPTLEQKLFNNVKMQITTTPNSDCSAEEHKSPNKLSIDTCMEFNLPETTTTTTSLMHEHHMQQQQQQQQPLVGGKPTTMEQHMLTLNKQMLNSPKTHNSPSEIHSPSGKDGEQRRKRKREYQKHRRQLLNNSKGANANNNNNINNFSGKSALNNGMQMNTAAALKKARPRKLSKAEEDYDNFIDNLMAHIRQMHPIQVLEPVLNRHYGVYNMYGTCRQTAATIPQQQQHSRELEGKSAPTINNQLSGEFGNAHKPHSSTSLYDSGHISNDLKAGSGRESLAVGAVGEKRLPSIQNDFYDQEFSPILYKSERHKLLRFIGVIRERNLDTLDIVAAHGGECDDKILQEFPALMPYNQTINNNNNINSNNNLNTCLGRMSPVVPLVQPFSLKIRRFCMPLSDEAQKQQQQQQIEQASEKLFKTASVGSNQTVFLSMPMLAADNVLAVLRDLANLLHISPPSMYKIEAPHVLPTHTLPNNLLKRRITATDRKSYAATYNQLQHILNGKHKMCHQCGAIIKQRGVAAENNECNILNKYNVELPLTVGSGRVHYCSTTCYVQAKITRKNNILNRTNNAAENRVMQAQTANNKQEAESEALQKDKHNSSGEHLHKTKKCRFRYYSTKCFNNAPQIRHASEREITDMLFKMDITVAAKYSAPGIDGNMVQRQLEDPRQCVFCNQQGDGLPDGTSRLLNFEVDKWVHLNCALWSNGVYETISGGLMNFQMALQMGLSQLCIVCQQYGATVKCFKPRCSSVYHLPCAIKDRCVFYKNKTIHCHQHAPRIDKENELTSLAVQRRVFVERDENSQVASVMHHSEMNNLLRVGSLTFLNVGQLLPHQLEAFHTPNYIYPIGYKIIRFYWSMKRPNKRCRYICSIGDVGGRPEFRVQVQEPMERDLDLRDITPKGVWQRILRSIAALRKEHELVQLFPQFITGEDLFGLTEPAIVRILESMPGIETLSNYRYKYGRNPLLELPLAINPSGAARAEPKQRHILTWRKPHTQRTSTTYNQRNATATSPSVAGEVACPYSKQFVHSKSSQYKKMKQEWRNNVFLARSKIQGLGLYAARDMERHTMIIEYIGEVIRTEVSEIREKQYEDKNRGIYMFRLDEERVVDATLSGGLARYINHSCNPNCVTEIVEVDRELRIIIFAKRRINRGEELSYDYKFDIEDDANKIQCMCGAPNCRKWMN